MRITWQSIFLLENTSMIKQMVMVRMKINIIISWLKDIRCITSFINTISSTLIRTNHDLLSQCTRDNPISCLSNIINQTDTFSICYQEFILISIVKESISIHTVGSNNNMIHDQHFLQLLGYVNQRINQRE